MGDSRRFSDVLFKKVVIGSYAKVKETEILGRETTEKLSIFIIL